MTQTAPYPLQRDKIISRSHLQYISCSWCFNSTLSGTGDCCWHRLFFVQHVASVGDLWIYHSTSCKEKGLFRSTDYIQLYCGRSKAFGLLLMKVIQVSKRVLTGLAPFLEYRRAREIRNNQPIISAARILSYKYTTMIRSGWYQPDK